MAFRIHVTIAVDDSDNYDGPLIHANYSETVQPEVMDTSDPAGGFDDYGALMVHKADLLMQQAREAMAGQVEQVVTLAKAEVEEN